LSDSDIGAGLRRAIEQRDPVSIAVHAGRLLEQASDTLSWTFPTSVSRRFGDRYTLGDLWPGVFSVLKKTTIAEQAAEVDRYMHLRNILGMHVNAWAEGVSLQEATRFGEGVLSLLDSVWCAECGRWVERSPTRVTWVCRCGARKLSRPDASVDEAGSSSPQPAPAKTVSQPYPETDNSQANSEHLKPHT
jgi:hypothetical protein